MNYRMQCTCGHALYRAGATREEAVEKFKAAMTQATVEQHVAKYHNAGEAVPTQAQVHAMIEQSVIPADVGLVLRLPALTATA
jgi:hypothetical protein